MYHTLNFTIIPGYLSLSKSTTGYACSIKSVALLFNQSISNVIVPSNFIKLTVKKESSDLFWRNPVEHVVLVVMETVSKIYLFEKNDILICLL